MNMSTSKIWNESNCKIKSIDQGKKTDFYHAVTNDVLLS